jgi:hypothetical protein
MNEPLAQGDQSRLDSAIADVELALSRLERASGSADSDNIIEQHEKARETFDDVTALLNTLSISEGQHETLLERLTLLRTMLQAQDELF